MTRDEFETRYIEISTLLNTLKLKRENLCRAFREDNEFNRFKNRKVEFCHKGMGKSPYAPFIFKGVQIDDYGFINIIGHKLTREGSDSNRRVEYIMTTDSFVREV